MIETRADLKPDAETLARWWVQLNAWTWPPELPYPPVAPATEAEWKNAIRGAFAVVNLFADTVDVDRLWRSGERQQIIDAGTARPEGAE